MLERREVVVPVGFGLMHQALNRGLALVGDSDLPLVVVTPPYLTNYTQGLVPQASMTAVSIRRTSAESFTDSVAVVLMSSLRGLPAAIAKRAASEIRDNARVLIEAQHLGLVQENGKAYQAWQRELRGIDFTERFYYSDL